MPPNESGEPIPFQQFVLKMHSRCNLACTYCYIYTGPDDSWRDRPPRMPETTIRHVAHRIGEHATAHGLESIRVELHGGEPLLAGAAPLLAATDAVRAAVPRTCSVAFTVQTNGTLLTAGVLHALSSAGISVGLSLDGGNAALNHRRVDHAGRSSMPAVIRAAELLRGTPQAYAGILSTLDIRANPDDVYRSLLALAPPTLDFLLPHANWSAPPPGIEPVRDSPGRSARHVPYGRWLSRAFDLWWSEDRLHTRIRLFSEIVTLLFGAASATESVGLSPMAAVVVDTDGAVEQIDSLKSTFAGAPYTGLDVFEHSFDSALRHPGNLARRSRTAALSKVCRTCPIMHVCGGGNYAHRYLHGSGFRHPSVYCADLEHLIRHIAERLRNTLHGPEEKNVPQTFPM